MKLTKKKNIIETLILLFFVLIMKNNLICNTKQVVCLRKIKDSMKNPLGRSFSEDNKSLKTFIMNCTNLHIDSWTNSSNINKYFKTYEEKTSAIQFCENDIVGN